ncbi:hypothetical protein EMIT0P294_140013 [Pseudomonas sp. IT-P294]
MSGLRSGCRGNGFVRGHQIKALVGQIDGDDMGTVQAQSAPRSEADQRGQPGVEIVQAFQGIDQLLAAGVAPGLLHAFTQQQHRTVGADLQHRVLTAEPLVFAQLRQRQASGQRPVTGHERICQKHPSGKITGHLKQISSDLIRRREQVRHLPRRLQALGQLTETAAAAQVEHRARAQRQFVLRGVVGLQPHLLPGVVLQVLIEGLRRQALARLVRVGDQRRPLQHAQTAGGVVGQGEQLLAQARQRFENLPTGLGRALQRERSDQWNPGAFQTLDQFRVERRRQWRNQGEHLFLPDQALQRLLGTGTIGPWVEDGQAQLPAMNPPRLIDPCHASPEHRRHRGALFTQRPLARQQGTQVQAVGAQAGIAVIGHTLEVSHEVALIIHRQHEPRHGRVQSIVGRVTPLLDGTGQCTLGVGRVIAAIDLLLTVTAGKTRPTDVRWPDPALGPPLTVGAMTIGARQAGGGQQHIRRTDPGHDRLTARRHPFAVQPFTGAFAGAQRQRMGGKADAAKEEQAEDEGRFHGPDSTTGDWHCQQLQALGNGGSRRIGTDLAPAFVGHVTHDQLR